MTLVWQMYRLLINLPTFSSCFNNFIKLFIKIYETSVEYICCEIISTDDIANGEATRSGPSPAVDHWCPPHTFKIYAPHFIYGSRLLHTSNILFKKRAPLMIFGFPGCEILATGLCQIQETGMNAVIYLTTDAIVLIVDTRLRLLTEIIWKGMQK